MNKKQTIATIVTGSLLAAAVTVAVLLPGTRPQGSAQSEPPADEIRLTGIVRDFTADHPDFALPTATGGGHHASNVAHVLPAGSNPSFTPGIGYRVTIQWKDAGGRPIAPHLFGAAGAVAGEPGGVGVRVHETIEISGTTVIDSFDPSLGPYDPVTNHASAAIVSTNSTASGAVDLANGSLVKGDVLVGPGGTPASVITGGGSITGTTGVLEAVHPMPEIQLPSDAVVGPNVGDVWYTHDPATISGNMHVNDFRVSNDSVVTIDGHVTILVEGEFRTETRGVMQVLPGSTLDVYFTGPKFRVETRCLWSDPTAVRIFVVGTPEMKIQTDADFYGTIYAPNAMLLVQTGADLHGGYVGRQLLCKTGGSIHTCGGGPTSCYTTADVPGAAGSPGDGGITSEASFAQWFENALGVNMSTAYTIALERGADGVYEFLAADFFPVDDRLLGNEGLAHNFGFTFELDARFEYAECQGQFIELAGGDGAWVFIDDTLAIDLGGVGSGAVQRLDLDRLGLSNGQSARMRLYYAQRRARSSEFSLRTNIELTTENAMPAFTDQYD